MSDALRYLLEVQECLVLCIGGQFVRQSNEHANRQGRCQTQHIEQYLLKVQSWGVLLPFSTYFYYLVPYCQGVIFCFGAPRLDQRLIVGSFHHCASQIFIQLI